jgi:hypothetical protein
MKNAFLIIALLLVSGFKSYAQLSKGIMLIGGSINYSQSQFTSSDTSANRNTQTIKNSSYSGVVRYGYFVSSKFMVGIYGGYQGSVYDNEAKDLNSAYYYLSTNKTTSKTYSGGVFLRYYKMIYKNKFAVFGQLSTGYSNGNGTQHSSYINYNNTNSTQDNNSKISGFILGFTPGIVYFLTNKFGIETTFGNFGYNVQQTKNYNKGNFIGETKNQYSNASLSLSNISLGVYYYFGGKKDNDPAAQK